MTFILIDLLCLSSRNDRRVRYLADTFQAFLPRRPKAEPSDPSVTKSIRCVTTNFTPTDQLKVGLNSSEFDHIYSEDPLDEKTRVNKALLCEYLDRRPYEPTDEVIYETIQPHQESASPYSNINRP